MRKKSVERQIQDIYNKVFALVYSKKNLSKLSKGDRQLVLQAVAILESSEKYKKFAKKFAVELAKKGLRGQQGTWRKFYEAAKKKHVVALPKTWKEFEVEQLRKSASKNFEMITSIPRKTLDVLERKYTTVLIEEVAMGKRSRGSFQREMEKHGHKNAKLIARTETSKLQSGIIENRAVDLGSVCYRWLSSNDKRTRQSHREMNGVVVFWRQVQSERPYLDGMYGNAGEFPNCRCAPQPIFDEFDLDKSNYKVYDYKQKKVISMGKKQLLEAIKKGELT